MRDGNGTAITSSTGNTVASDCTQCAVGSVATLVATPAAGWKFAGWAGGCGTTESVCKVSMTTARTVRATFVDYRGYQLTVSAATAGGGVSSSWDWVADYNRPWSQTVAVGTPVTLVAKPAPNTVFAGWSGDCSGTGTCVIPATNTAARSVAASFTWIQPSSLTIYLQNAGQWEPWSWGEVDWGDHTPACQDYVCQIPFDPGAQVALIGASNSSQAGFGTFTGACTGPQSCALTMSQNRTVTAVLGPRTELLLSPVPQGGRITGPMFGGQGICGDQYVGILNCTYWADLWSYSVQLTATPDTGYKLDHWTGAAAACGSNPSCSMNVSGTQTVASAVFAQTGGGGGGGGGGCVIRCN